MKRTEKALRDVTIEITCDACGSSVVPELQKAHFSNLDNFNEFGVLQASFGYGSKQDGANFHFDLCEACFDQLVDTFKRMRAVNGVRNE